VRLDQRCARGGQRKGTGRRYRRTVTATVLRWAKLVVAAALPVAVASSWIPLRDRLPNTDLALLLVLVIATVGWTVGPAAALAAAVTSAVAFDLLDARPYGTLSISRGNDVATALLLLATGLLVGAGAARLARYRRVEDRRSDALAVVMEASSLVATGEEQRLVTEALGAELARALRLAACELHPNPPTGARPLVARDGHLVGLVAPSHGEARQLDLPVWCLGEVVAHYRLTLGAHQPSREELRVAVSLADQAGAAMANTERPPPPPPPPTGLRLVQPTNRPGPVPADPVTPPVARPGPGRCSAVRS
jgi:Domain of unknown function (DUF4118)